MSSAPVTPAEALQKVTGKFAPMLRQWLAFKAVVAVAVCAGFLIYYVGQLGAAEVLDARIARVGAAGAAVGLLASVQCVWSLWRRRRMPPLGLAFLSAAASPAMVLYWVWSAFLS